MDWDCPTWGCHGGLFTNGMPSDHETVSCARWPGTEAPVCGRLMRWVACREVWVAVSSCPRLPVDLEV